tara:strand:+ start:1604 stop:1735 length:132 start_codon:yes stop_codon:yes gene_type:complete
MLTVTGAATVNETGYVLLLPVQGFYESNNGVLLLIVVVGWLIE